MQLIVGTDQITFSVESDEFNGQTIDNLTGKLREKITRWYTSIENYVWENAQSRIYLGIHWVNALLNVPPIYTKSVVG